MISFTRKVYSLSIHPFGMSIYNHIICSIPMGFTIKTSCVMFDLKPNACLYSLALNDCFEMAYHGFCRWWYNLMMDEDVYLNKNITHLFCNSKENIVCTSCALLVMNIMHVGNLSSAGAKMLKAKLGTELWVVISARCSNILTCAMTTV